MYKKDSVKFGDVTDSSSDDYDNEIWAYLPHSCGQWVIGGKEQILDLIHDLQELILRQGL